MPAPIIDSLITYLAGKANASIWDGEVPRYDTSGNPINPDSDTSPSDWPVIKLYMTGVGFTRNYTFETAYTDTAPESIVIKIWGTSREQEEGVLDTVEAIFDTLATNDTWSEIPLPAPYYVIQMLLARWTSTQEEGVRTDQSQLLYRGELHYYIQIHGNAATQEL